MRFLFLSLALALPLHAQKSDQPYSAESYVVLNSQSVHAFHADGTGTREQTLAVRIQSEAALRELSVLNLPFAGASEKVEILYARSRHPDGSVTETPVGDALEQPLPVTVQAPFYSDLKSRQLPIRGLRVGDTVEWHARITRTKAEAPGNFWGQESFIGNAVALDEFVELRIPAGTHITVWTNPALTARFTESDEGPVHIYRWQQANLVPTAGPAAEAAKAARKKTLLTPAEEVDQREGAFPSLSWTTFPSWAAVGDWYRSLEAGRTVPDADIRARVAELTADRPGQPPLTPQQKVEAVYSFVAPQIRYIGVAFGVGRYQPHAAGEVLSNQYGDCKDKHTLLAAMLTVLGLHPQAVLIGQGIRFNAAVPSPAAFNHLITRVALTDGDTPIWLDATAEVAPYRVLNYDLRDKQALVVPDSASAPATIERTPESLPFPAFENLTSVGAITKDGIADSHLTLTLRGDGELATRTLVRQVPPAQYAELVQGISQSMGYGGTTSHPEIARPEDTSGPFSIAYDYHRDLSKDWAAQTRVIPQFEPLLLPSVDAAEPPVGPIYLGPPKTELSTSELKLPEHWTAELPEAIHEKTAFATVDVTYRFEKGTVYSERKLVILEKSVPAANWKAYQKFTDAIGLGTENYIILHHAGETASNSAAAAASNPEAAKLVERAIEAIRKGLLNEATALLDQAKAINPTQRNLWGDYAAITYDRGHPPDAIPSYRKELALHPDSFWVYAPLSRAELFANNHPAAIATLRAWAAAAPTDTDATLSLVSLLLKEGQPAEALEAMNQALLALPEEQRHSENLQLLLGKTQLAAGKKDAGDKTLTALLNTSDSPLTLNDAAYELADASLELPLAEAASRKSLHRLSAETSVWTLDENLQTIRQQSSLLIAAWDTLGWILHREGKDEDAEDYIAAAWALNQSPDEGEHLGDIESARNEHSAAFGSYQLTLFALPLDFVSHKAADTRRPTASRPRWTPKRSSSPMRSLCSALPLPPFAPPHSDPPRTAG